MSGKSLQADDDPSPQSVWLPAFARFVGAPVPPHMSEEEATVIAGEDAVYYATKLSGIQGCSGSRPKLSSSSSEAYSSANASHECGCYLIKA